MPEFANIVDADDMAHKFVVCFFGAIRVEEKSVVSRDCQLQLTIQNIVSLTLEAPITTSADDIHKYFFVVFQRK